VSLVAAQLRGVEWMKAHASVNNGACVEVASIGDFVAVHDSKEPEGPALTYTPREWEAFIRGVKNGEFDHFATSTSE
jgi:predicted secreted Zn-dependent protease